VVGIIASGCLLRYEVLLHSGVAVQELMPCKFCLVVWRHWPTSPRRRPDIASRIHAYGLGLVIAFAWISFTAGFILKLVLLS
jgi:hypothetical protein